MSHRNSQPKPNASERTQRRWRIRKEIPTVADEKHQSQIAEIKENILSWFKKPEEEQADVKPMPGARR